MQALVQRLFASFIRTGNIRVTTAKGRTFVLGDGSGKPIAVRFTSAAAELGVLLDPGLKFGETYMNGGFIVEEGSIADLMALLLSQDFAGNVPRWVQPQLLVRRVWNRLLQFNRQGWARKKVAHDHGLQWPFYSLLLDKDRQLSSAYFETPDQPLDEAQLAKKRHIAAKLLLKPGCRVLDMGSGWGGLALYLAEICGARVKGLTLSQEQFERSKAQADENGLASSVEFRLEDYRDVSGIFDRIVAVELVEYIGGAGRFNSFFRKCAELISEDGVIVLRSVGCSEGADRTDPFIAKYITPGSYYIPALSQLLRAIERAGLLVTDIEVLGPHYSETLKAWRERLLEHRAEIERLYGARFYRMWEFWSAGSEIAFRQWGVTVFQIQLTKRQGVVPITREYIAREESRLRGIEPGRGLPHRLAGE